MRGFIAVFLVVLAGVFASQAEQVVNRKAKGDLIFKEILETKPSPEPDHFLVTVKEIIPRSIQCLQGEDRRREKAAEYCQDPAHAGKYESGRYLQHQIGNPRYIPDGTPMGYNNAKCVRKNRGVEMTQTFLVQCTPKKNLLNGTPILPAGSFDQRR